MAKQITDRQRQVLEMDRCLCAEIPAKHDGHRAWIAVAPLLEGDAIDHFVVRRFEFKIEWMEREYDPGADELVDHDRRKVYTETEVNNLLEQWLPENVELIPVADDPDFPL